MDTDASRDLAAAFSAERARVLAVVEHAEQHQNDDTRRELIAVLAHHAAVDAEIAELVSTEQTAVWAAHDTTMAQQVGQLESASPGESTFTNQIGSLRESLEVDLTQHTGPELAAGLDRLSDDQMRLVVAMLQDEPQEGGSSRSYVESLALAREHLRSLRP